MKIITESYFDKFDKNKRKSRFISRSGSSFAKTYEYQIIDGIKTLVKSGETNTQEFIDSFAPSADINNIISRFLNGDTSVFNQVVGQFGDFRNCPTTYAEIFDRVQKCESLFNSLPVDIKEKFDNSYQKFWSDFGSEHFDNIFSAYNDQLNNSGSDPVESEVLTDAE